MTQERYGTDPLTRKAGGTTENDNLDIKQMKENGFDNTSYSYWIGSKYSVNNKRFGMYYIDKNGIWTEQILASYNQTTNRTIYSSRSISFGVRGVFKLKSNAKVDENNNIILED